MWRSRPCSMWEAFRQVPRLPCPKADSKVLTGVMWFSLWELSPPAEGMQVLEAVISIGPLPGHMDVSILQQSHPCCPVLVYTTYLAEKKRPYKATAGQLFLLTGKEPSPNPHSRPWQVRVGFSLRWWVYTKISHLWWGRYGQAVSCLHMLFTLLTKSSALSLLSFQDLAQMLSLGHHLESHPSLF